MSLVYVLDGLTADPMRLYELVQEELNLRAVPGIKYDWDQEFEKKGMLGPKGERLASLKIDFPESPYGGWRIVFACQYGQNFYVRSFHRFPKESVVIDTEMLLAKETVIDAIVERSVKKAVKRLHSEIEGAPEVADPHEAFVVKR